MILVAFDYGRKKVGMAVADGPMARPVKVIRGRNFQEILDKSVAEIEFHEAQKVIIGLSEGQLSFEQKNFASEIAKRTSLPVELQDETLTTYDAKRAAIEAGIGRLKRKKMEDAYSAALILQSYLDG